MDAIALHEKTVGRLRGHEGKYAEISRRSGLSYSTLVKLAQGHMDNPTVGTLQQVIEALDDFEGVPKPVRIDTPEAAAAVLPVVAGTATDAPDAEPDPDAGRVGPVEEVA